MMKETGAMKLVGMTAAGMMIGEGGPRKDSMIREIEVTKTAGMATEMMQVMKGSTMTKGLGSMTATVTRQQHAARIPGTACTIGRATTTAMRTGPLADIDTRSG